AENADDLDSWYGVTTNAEGRVVKLELRGEKNNNGYYTGNNVIGAIPSELCQLGAMKKLDLSWNGLTGEFDSKQALV
ncbi:unnamed protein product, partial [Ectocarpus fasciculatus]